jgi:O-antigen ligase
VSWGTRAISPGIAGIALTVIVIALCWDSGGYFAESYLNAGAAAFAVTAVLLVLAPPRHRTSRSALLALGALAGLAAWTGLSALWSEASDAALVAMQRDLAYLGIFSLALVAVGSGRYARHVMWGVLAVIAIVVGASLFSRIYPGLVSSPGIDETVNFRLGYPLTYWNALGCLAAIGAVLGLGLAADPRTAWPLRAACAGFSVVAVTTMYLSLSRGAWLALGVGVIVVVVLGAHRGSLLLSLAIIGVGSALAVARASGYDALVTDPHLGAGQASDGRAFGLQLWGLVLLVVVAQGVIAAGRASPRLMDTVDRVGPRLVAVLGTIAAVVIAGAYVVKAADAEGVTARSLNDAQDWVSRQWHDFMRPTTPGLRGTQRLTTAHGSRSDLYRVAIDGFEGNPIAGDGAGSFTVRFTRDRRIKESAVNAHSLELETLGEEGIIGLGLLLAFLGAGVRAAVRQRRHTGSLTRSQVAAVGGAGAVWLAHSAVDWDWQVTGLTAIVLVLIATLFPYGRRSRRREAAARPAPG